MVDSDGGESGESGELPMDAAEDADAACMTMGRVEELITSYAKLTQA